MASREDLIASFKELIAILRELLATGDWEASLFLRTAQKKLDSIIQESITFIEALQQESAEKNEDKNTEAGYVKVFVSIYQTDANNLIKWQNTLSGITEYSVSRPIYRSEEHIRTMIRAKNSINEAYATVLIKEEDIIPPYAGKPIEDRFGHELLTVREGSIKPINIVEFVHQERKYSYKLGKLLVKSNAK